MRIPKTIITAKLQILRLELTLSLVFTKVGGYQTTSPPAPLTSQKFPAMPHFCNTAPPHLSLGLMPHT